MADTWQFSLEKHDKWEKSPPCVPQNLEEEKRQVLISILKVSRGQKTGENLRKAEAGSNRSLYWRISQMSGMFRYVLFISIMGFTVGSDFQSF